MIYFIMSDNASDTTYLIFVLDSAVADRVGPWPGKNKYHPGQIDFYGSSLMSAEVQAELDASPGEYNLSQNYPNPFIPATTISYSIREYTNISIIQDYYWYFLKIL